MIGYRKYFIMKRKKRKKKKRRSCGIDCIWIQNQILDFECPIQKGGAQRFPLNNDAPPNNMFQYKGTKSNQGLFLITKKRQKQNLFSFPYLNVLKQKIGAGKYKSDAYPKHKKNAFLYFLDKFKKKCCNSKNKRGLSAILFRSLSFFSSIFFFF